MRYFGYFLLLLTVNIAGASTVSEDAKNLIKVAAALDKVVELEKTWNRRYAGRVLKGEEERQADREKAELEEVSAPIRASVMPSLEALKRSSAAAGLFPKDGQNWVDFAKQCSQLSGTDRQSNDSDVRGSLSKISAKITGRSPLPQISKTAYVFDVKVTVTLSGPSGGYSNVTFSTSGEASEHDGGAPIVGSNTISIKPKAKSATGTIKIQSYMVQNVTLTAKLGESEDSATLKLK